MEIAFFGTPDFAVPTLEALLRAGHHVLAAVCQPDQPSGRHLKTGAPPVKLAAQSHNIPVLQPKTIRSKNGERQKAFLHELTAACGGVVPRAIVVTAYGKILPREVLEYPPLGCFNVHASLLPKYRGAAPIQWAIAMGETETGITIMQMDEGMDTGDVLAMETEKILPDDDATSMSQALSVIGGNLMARVLTEIEQDNPPARQSQAGMGEPTMAPILRKEDGRIDWSKTSELILCRMQGFTPWPGCYTTLPSNELLAITAAEPFPQDDANEEEMKAPVGRIVRSIRGEGFIVRTGDGLLLVKEVKPANRSKMPAASALNGRVVQVGMQLG